MTVRDWRLGEMPSDKLEKLPKFAQAEILHLRTQIGWYEAKLTEITEEISEKETNIILDDFGEARRGIPKDTHVKFDLNPKIGTWNWQKEVSVRISDRFKIPGSRQLEVQGGKSIAIHPRGSNLVYVTVED